MRSQLVATLVAATLWRRRCSPGTTATPDADNIIASSSQVTSSSGCVATLHRHLPVQARTAFCQQRAQRAPTCAHGTSAARLTVTWSPNADMNSSRTVRLGSTSNSCAQHAGEVRGQAGWPSGAQSVWGGGGGGGRAARQAYRARQASPSCTAPPPQPPFLMWENVHPGLPHTCVR